MESEVRTLKPQSLDRGQRAQRVILAVGLAGSCGILEWLLRLGWRGDGDAGALVAIGVAYPVFGLVIGVLASANRRICQSRPTLLLAVPVILLLLNSTRGLDSFLESVLGIAALLVAGVVVSYIDRRGNSLAIDVVHRPEVWWGVMVAGLSLALAQAIGEQNYSTAKILALATPLTCAAVLVLGFVKLRRAYVFTAYVLALVGCAVVATRNNVPTLGSDSGSPDALPNLLLVTIDTLRADHLGAYAYQKARTPNLDAIAGHGQTFTQAIAPAYRTGPSHASILTGQLPEQHGVLRNLERLEESVETVVDLLRPEGYVSAAFPSGYTTEDSATGLPSRFDWYNDDLRSHLRWIPKRVTRLVLLHYGRRLLESVTGDDIVYPMYRPAAPTARVVNEWFVRNGDVPFFAWLHFYDPHLPYQSPPQYLEAAVRDYEGPVSGRWYDLSQLEVETITSSPDHVQQMLDLYDGEIAYVDDQLGEIMSVVRARSGERELITLVTSDHGESMGEHGLFWDRDLYDPTLRVPLIIASSEGAIGPPGIIEDQVRLIDIAPTILDLVGAPIPTSMEGRSVKGLIAGRAGGERSARSSFYPETNEDNRLPSFAVREDGWKLIWRQPGWLGDEFSEERYELFDLGDDGGELRDRASSLPAVVDRLRPAFGDVDLDRIEPKRKLSEEQRRRLRSLGYIR